MDDFAAALDNQQDTALDTVENLGARRKKILQKLNHLAQQASFLARVEFLVLVYRHNLAEAIRNEELYGEGREHLTGRHVDDCLENDDAPQVLAALFQRARAEGFIGNIQRERGPEFRRWEALAEQGARQVMDHGAVCARLKTLSRRSSFEARVEFLALAYEHNLVSAMLAYRLWDAGYEGLGPRQFDACLEAGDGETVIAELIQRARREGYVENIREECGDALFSAWCCYADRQVELF